MKKATLTRKQATQIERILQAFTESEFPGFVSWMKGQWRANRKALLAVNPPNHKSDIEDGTHDVVIGQKQVIRKRKHHQELKGSIFEYRIRFDGSLHDLLGTLKNMSEEVQQEAAMAFFLEYRQGDYLCNTAEWREVAKILGNKSNNLYNPFYKGVCVAILGMFRAEGWMD
jgi:hypothetical protein